MCLLHSKNFGNITKKLSTLQFKNLLLLKYNNYHCHIILLGNSFLYFCLFNFSDATQQIFCSCTNFRILEAIREGKVNTFLTLCIGSEFRVEGDREIRGKRILDLFQVRKFAVLAFLDVALESVKLVLLVEEYIESRYRDRETRILIVLMKLP